MAKKTAPISGTAAAGTFICPYYLLGHNNGIYYYAAFTCPAGSQQYEMKSTRPLQTGCPPPSNPDCTTINLNLFKGFDGGVVGIKQPMPLEEVWLKTLPYTTLTVEDCKFQIPSKSPGAGLWLACRCFHVCVSAHGCVPACKLCVGQELALAALFVTTEAPALSTSVPNVFDVECKGITYNVLTVPRG